MRKQLEVPCKDLDLEVLDVNSHVSAVAWLSLSCSFTEYGGDGKEEATGGDYARSHIRHCFARTMPGQYDDLGQTH